MDFPQELRHAIRSLSKSPVLTIAAVVTLGLGIGANSAMFGVVDRLFFRPPAHVVDPARVVRIEVRTTNRSLTYNAPIGSYPRYEALREHTRSFSSVAAYGGASLSVGLGPDAEEVRAALVTASFFPLLGVRPEWGRFISPDEDRLGGGAHVAVLSAEFWKRRYGRDPGVLGKALSLGKSVYTIIGVAPEGFTGIDLRVPDLWLPITTAAPEVLGPDALGPGWVWMSGVIGRLGPDIALGTAAAEATIVYRSQYPERHDSATVLIQSVHDFSGVRSGTKLAVWLSVVSGIVLLIACANVANLLLARAIQRRREVAVRVALGASRFRLARHVLTESAVLSAAGGLVALAMSFVVAPLIFAALLPNATVGKPMSFRILVFTSSAVILTMLVAGLVPALSSGKADLGDALKAGVREGGTPRSRVRLLLLAGQVALAVILLSGAGLFVVSMRNVRSIPVGFDAEHVISISEDLESLGYAAPDIDAAYQRIAYRLSQSLGVEEVSLAVGSPWGMGMSVSMSASGVDSMPSFEGGGPFLSAVTPNYFAVMGTKIQRGRGFTGADVRGSGWVTIVSEDMAARVWPRQEALGKCLMIMRRTRCTQVVGVAQNTHRNMLVEKPGVGEYYIPLAQRDSVTTAPVTALLVRTRGSAEDLSSEVQREVQASFRDLPYPQVSAYPSLFASELRPWKTGSTLLSIFGGLGLVLAAVGLFGVLSFVVSQRTQEMGIRIALGAARSDVLQLVVWQGLRVTLVGIAVGVLTSLLAGRAVAAMLYGVSPRDPLILMAVSVLLTIVAATASFLPAMRATKVDPMEALRYE